MRWVTLLVAVAALGFASRLTAADLSKIDRTITKEPAYATKAPRYCLLVFGPDAKDRVWLVQDGDALYVDRNGNGDLTEAGEKVPAAKNAGPKEEGYTFEVGDVTPGGTVHKGVSVGLAPLKQYAGNPSLAAVQAIRDALKADPNVVAARIGVDVQSARFKGAGVGGRTMQSAGFFDPTGVLAFAGKPADAPVVHLDGPLQVSFYGEVPKLWLSRDNDLVLTVGTPGLGGGTFAMLVYEDTIPKAVRPTVEVRWPGEPPVKEHFELKQRC
ncbi:MAG TPA: hypothetical protein VFG68_14660 [Fimbriiglobus sp.]|nr:hypothetical protein [Fimbriiglobus sp.]